MLKTTKKVKYFFKGKDLREAREKADFTQAELAENVPFWTQQRISAIEASNCDHWLNPFCLTLLNRII